MYAVLYDAVEVVRMGVSESKRASNDKWDRANMAYKTVKVRRELLDDFEAACRDRGDKANTIMREAMEQYTYKERAGDE